MLRTIILLFFTLPTLLAWSQFDDQPLEKEAGKCYAKCLITQRSDTTYVSIHEYIGDDPAELRYVRTTKIAASPELVSAEFIEGEWVNAELDESQIELPTVQRIKKIKKANLKLREFEIVQHHQGEQMEWREVVCNANVTGNLAGKISQALQLFGVEMEYKETLDEELKRHLVEFQRKHHLPVGQLDIETMEKLGISSRLLWKKVDGTWQNSHDF